MSSSSPPLAPGDHVTRRGSRGTGEVIELLRNGFVRVAFGSLTIRCAAVELSKVERVKRRSSEVRASVSATRLRSARSGTSPTLDLHGCTRNEAIARLSEALNQAALNGCDQIEVIHGLGRDTLRRAVHEHLTQIPIVARFALKMGNPGATIVYLG